MAWIQARSSAVVMVQSVCFLIDRARWLQHKTSDHGDDPSRSARPSRERQRMITISKQDTETVNDVGLDVIATSSPKACQFHDRKYWIGYIYLDQWPALRPTPSSNKEIYSFRPEIFKWVSVGYWTAEGRQPAAQDAGGFRGHLLFFSPWFSLFLAAPRC